MLIHNHAEECGLDTDDLYKFTYKHLKANLKFEKELAKSDGEAGLPPAGDAFAGLATKPASQQSKVKDNIIGFPTKHNSRS